MGTASRIWLLPTMTQTQSRSAWEMAWAALAAQLKVSVGANPYSVAIGDFNGDGKQDLAVANYVSNTVSIRLGDGLGGFSGSTEVSVGSGPISVAIGDFNGDGKQDLALLPTLLKHSLDPPGSMSQHLHGDLRRQRQHGRHGAG